MKLQNRENGRAKNVMKKIRENASCDFIFAGFVFSVKLSVELGNICDASLKETLKTREIARVLLF